MGSTIFLIQENIVTLLLKCQVIVLFYSLVNSEYIDTQYINIQHVLCVYCLVS